MSVFCGEQLKAKYNDPAASGQLRPGGYWGGGDAEQGCGIRGGGVPEGDTAARRYRAPSALPLERGHFSNVAGMKLREGESTQMNCDSLDGLVFCGSGAQI